MPTHWRRESKSDSVAYANPYLVRAKHLPLLFSNDLPGILVSPHADKLDMTYVVRVRPFEEFEICYELGLHPNALLHLRGSESLTPSATLQFRQVRECVTFREGFRPRFVAVK